MEEPKTAQIIEAPMPGEVEEKIAPRGQRIIKLAMTNGKIVDCHIKPLLLFIKQEVQRSIRRQMIIRAKLEGIEQRRLELSQEVTGAYAKNAENAGELEKNLEALYEQVAKDEDSYRKANFAIVYAVAAIPPYEESEGVTRPATEKDVDWEKCEIAELENAQLFFLTP